MYELSFEGFDYRGAGARLHAEVRRGMDRAARFAAESAERKAREVAPVRTGNLRGSVSHRPASGSDNVARYDVIASAKYASFVSEGTRPHLITARRARVLHFFAGGREVFTRQVRHPGTKPNPFWWLTLSHAADQLRAATERAMQDAVLAIDRS
jgi:hypothetical protein